MARAEGDNVMHEVRGHGRGAFRGRDRGGGSSEDRGRGRGGES